MRMTLSRRGAASVAALLGWAVLGGITAGAGSARAGWIHPELERRLARPDPLAPLPANPRDDAPDGADDDERWIVWITLRDETADPSALFAGLPDCQEIGRIGPMVEARAPRDQIRRLAALDAVRAVGLPPRPHPLSRSQGIEGMRADQYWPRFGTGRGVRLGVIDVGFAGYERLLGSELPADTKVKSFYFLYGDVTDITGEGEDHGTACAEIAADVAPEAELYLANAGSPIELQMAVDWMIESGVEVISHSVGWPVGIGDGTGPLADIVTSATRQGVLWVNAAGNFGQANWSGLYHDADGDRVSEVADDGEELIYLPPINAGQEISAWLLWDAWPSSPDLSFELDLLDVDGTILTSSQHDWAEWPYAFRPIAYRGPGYLDGLTLRIRSVRGTPAGHRLRVVRLDDDLRPESRVGAGSLAVPADSPEAIAVGAFGWNTQIFEPFSSYGPNFSGLPKPEILGPDGVMTTTFGSSGSAAFYGTSAACPHVAGAAALLLSTGVRGGLFDGRFDRATILEFLRREAGSIAAPYPDGAIGWGRVRLPIEPLSEKRLGPRLVVHGYGAPGGPVLRLQRAPVAGGPLRIHDVTGRRVGELQAARDGADWIYAPRLLETGLARGRYWARESTTGERAAFYWPGSRP